MFIRFKFILLILLTSIILIPNFCFANDDTKYAPNNTKFVNIELTADSSGQKVVRATTNVAVPNLSVYSTSIFLSTELNEQIKKDTNNNVPLKLYQIYNLNNIFFASFTTKGDSQIFDENIKFSGDPDAVSEIILFGINTPQGLELSNPIILSNDDTYKVLPAVSLEKVFTSEAYLNFSNICPKDNQKIACQTLAFLFNRFNFNINFDNPFALKNPILYSFLIFGYFFLTILIIIFLVLSYLLTFIFQRKPWGVVFDSKTFKPIEGAIVRIFAEDNKKLLETRVTDKKGRFGFLPKVGNYYIQVVKPGFIFPTKTLMGYHHPSYYHIYHGEEIIITQKDAMFVTNIPLDPMDKQITTQNTSLFSKLFFDIARARIYWLIIFLLMLILNYFFQIIPVLQSSDPKTSPDSQIQIQMIILILALIMEFYYWFIGRRVKIIKK